MAGTINLALTQQFDMDGRPLSGGLLSFFQAASTTPQNAFQDEALTIVLPNPVVLDASGRVPMFYLADGHIKIRLTDKNGVTIIAADNLLVTGGSSGAAPPPPVDATKQLQTGDIKARFGTGQLTGFARCNGNTIGNSASGATELADTTLAQDLFVLLYATSLPIFQSNGSVGTKSGNALTDFGANMRMGLPDLRGRAIAGMDDMGAAAANRLTATGLGISATALGNGGGGETSALAIGNLPAHTHTQQGTFVTGLENQTHAHGGSTAFALSTHTHTTGGFGNFYTTGGATFANLSAGSFALGSVGSTDAVDLTHAHSFVTGTEDANHNHTFSLSGVTSSIGANSVFSNVMPAMVMTFYIKL